MKTLLYKSTLSSVICSFLIGFTLQVHAQNYSVKPADDFVADLKNQHRIIMTEVEKRDDLTLPQKLALLESETNKLKTKFKKNRTAEYKSKSTKLSVSHSCTSKSSGGVKNCKTKCVSAPSPDLYTTRNWIKLQGKSKGISVDPTGRAACLRMTVAGKGHNAGTITATFKYKPDRIVELVDKDMTYVFTKVVENQ